MAEFIRKKRVLYYNDGNLCKKYLRKDFIRKCAYCQTREADIGNPDNFQIDHFKPKSGDSKVSDLDEYVNLFYSCSSCNGKSGKSDYWSATLLNPCSDDIFDRHISLREDFIYDYLSDEGKEYIEAFKLNRKMYVQRRKKLAESKAELQNKKACVDKKYNDLLTNGNIDEKVKIELQELRSLLFPLMESGLPVHHNMQYFDEDIEDCVHSRLEQHYSVKAIDEDFDLHLEISLNGHSAKIHMRICDTLKFDNGRARLYLREKYFELWKTEESTIIIMTICRATMQIFFTKYCPDHNGSIFIYEDSELTIVKGNVFDL